jgi:hypothetical protein
MKQKKVVVFLLSFYFFVSYLVYAQLLKARSLFFVFISIAYLLFTYCFQFIIFRFDSYVMYSHSSDESGRINELIIGVFFICILTAFINIIAAMAGKENKRRKNAIKDNNHVHA